VTPDAERRLTWWVLGLAALASCAPAWIVAHPPLQDYPYHLATLRIVHSIDDPAFGFARDFILTMGRTSYVGCYWLGDLLAKVFGVRAAGRLLLSLYLGGTVLALGWLLHEMRRDVRVAIYAVPLVANPLFFLGLIPYLLAIPVLFGALACGARLAARPTVPCALLLSGFALSIVALHVTLFGLVALGVLALVVRHGRRARVLAALSLAPAIVAVSLLLTCTDAGSEILDAMFAPSPFARLPLWRAARDLYNWIGNVFVDGSDEVVFGALVLVAVVGQVWTGPARIDRPIDRAYVALPAACALLYFFGKPQHGSIWPIGQRFAIVGALALIPLLRLPEGWAGRLVFAAGAVVAVGSVVNVCAHFRRFEREEVGPFEEALLHIEPREHVAALIFDNGSRIVQNRPFLHFGSYYQAAKGGVIQFSFAGYTYWPVAYRPGRYPPPGAPARPGWEWSPETVEADELFPYYDHLLVRGEGFAGKGSGFHETWSGGTWSIWTKE
jgi:hypothetical protein